MKNSAARPTLEITGAVGYEGAGVPPLSRPRGLSYMEFPKIRGAVAKGVMGVLQANKRGVQIRFRISASGFPNIRGSTGF